MFSQVHTDSVFSLGCFYLASSYPNVWYAWHACWSVETVPTNPAVLLQEILICPQAISVDV